MLYGALLVALGVVLFTIGVTWISISLLAGPLGVRTLGGPLLYYSGLPVIAGIALAFIDLAFFLPKKRVRQKVRNEPVHNNHLTVVLTAFNDELSIGPAVLDFLSHPLVRDVLVIDNNSVDGTREAAERAGATVIREDVVGYGSCVYRAFQESLKTSGTELVLLCEGDRTFRAADIEKFLAYIPHAEIVNGTRIVEQLRERDTQLSTFIYYGNFAIGKLLELKHIGRGTFTDVGTTYKLCRKRALERLLPHLDRRVNLEFNAHFLDTALQQGIEIVECPITFFARVGQSKGGNVNNLRALKTGLRMLLGMLISWRLIAQDQTAG
jgi:glycosyltransferase involved in cell wall biosynthesis